MFDYVIYLVFECWCLLCRLSVVECLINHMILVCVYKIASRNDIVLRWFYSHICVEIANMYLSVISDSCSTMPNDYELTMDYDMIVSFVKD